MCARFYATCIKIAGAHGPSARQIHNGSNRAIIHPLNRGMCQP
ncbi:hypothetical protein AG1IA_06446 [Rhizoctonia solani AG-1 IA]|uniref:Uncharacterized protein n=1 Tax=Thanatephorus cucumeris (strain AG1-IA) TaxID=983506 RepID=L8WRU6_THACA|nr:hypothetical protein AG1IA_06446 [Rhizoctonia solani AG-1 IA]